MSILVEYSVVISIKRDLEQNSVEVKYKLIGDIWNKDYAVVLLSDSVVELTEGIPFRYDVKYLYRQYLTAKGYSEYWKGNFFAEDE